LQAGAKISGTILYRALDLDSVEVLRLLLAFGANPNELPPGPPTADWGSPLLWAIRRRRSLAQIAALLEAGADPTAKTPDGASAYTLAQRFALPEVAGMLSRTDSTEPVSTEERFVAACARADEATARLIKSERPDLPGALSEAQLRLLPELTAQGCTAAVMLMVELGWPNAVRGGDWAASALNLAVFRGDAELTGFLVELEGAARLRGQCLWPIVLGLVQRTGRWRQLAGLRRGAHYPWSAKRRDRPGRRRWRDHQRAPQMVL